MGFVGRGRSVQARKTVLADVSRVSRCVTAFIIMYLH